LIDTHNPDEIAMKRLFWQNVQSMLKLGRAQVWQLLLDFRDIPITEYEPKKIKWLLLETEMPAKSRLLKCCSNCGTEELPKTSIARMVGCCGLSFSGKVGGNQSYTGWDAFLNKMKNELNSVQCSVFL
jgi:hypothetical protein